jgi:DNA-binding transcriptional ArsR family regulator
MHLALVGLAPFPTKPSRDRRRSGPAPQGATLVRGLAMVDDAAIDRAVAVISVLADRTRLGILAHLHAGELRVGQIQQRVGRAQALTSYHLRVLAEAGLVRRRRDGQAVVYAADPDGWDAAIATIRAVFAPTSSSPVKANAPTGEGRGAVLELGVNGKVL